MRHGAVLCGELSRIFNTDQESQFTSEDWATPLKAAGVAISMDGKGRWIDNIFIERLWRSVKYEEASGSTGDDRSPVYGTSGNRSSAEPTAFSFF